MKNLKVATKLIAGFLMAVALTAIVGATGIVGITRMDSVSEDMYLNKAYPLGDLATGMEYFQRLRVQTRNAIIATGDLDQLATIERDMMDRHEQFTGAMDNYAPTIASELGQSLFDEIVDQYDRIFWPGILNVLEGAKRGDSISELMDAMAVTTDAANAIADDLSGLTEARMGVMETANIDGTATGNRMLAIIIAVIIIAIVVSIVLALYISRLITKPLAPLNAYMVRAGSTGDIKFTPEELEVIRVYSQYADEIGQTIGATSKFIEHITTIAENLEVIAGGDLTPEVRTLSSNDVMANSLRSMLDKLNDMFTDINMSTSQVATGAKQVSDGSQQLAQGSTEQAASVQQLSASIADIAAKTKENAEMAERAAALANTVKGNAEKGNRQMDEMIAAVGEINDASKSISKVIKTIDDIAFQTNILALNAAVEAARAGQHGKGFAVVAEEVRSLAAKSADAAAETGSLIQNSIEKADLGSRIANETSTSLSEIVSGINESSALIGDIAKSSEEQTAGIEQINNGIDQVARVVQQNSATAEQSAAASEEMSGQSDMLQGLVEQFKLKNNGGSRFNLTAHASPAPAHGSPRADAGDASASAGADFGKY